MSAELEHVEIVVHVDHVGQIDTFYKPVLGYLGYTKIDSKPGLSIWRSYSRQTSLALVEATVQVFRGDAGRFPRATRLTFRAESEAQVHELYALLQCVDANILIDPERYSVSNDKLGVVFCCGSSSILELKWSG